MTRHPVVPAGGGGVSPKTSNAACSSCGTTFGEVLTAASGEDLCRDCYEKPQSSNGTAAATRPKSATNISHEQRDVADVALVALRNRGGVADLLAATEDFIGRYVFLPGEHESVALALWNAHTHAIEGAHATPYLLLMSPEKRSGKTRLLEVIELLVARPWRVAGASEAAMFRKIAQEKPTLLLDEIDAVFGSSIERKEPLRGILNAGNRPGASVARCVGEKGEKVRDFEVFCAKALAGIDTGRLPDTIRDRSIEISMRRKTSSEPVERFRRRHAELEAKLLREQLSAWGEKASEQLLAAEPDLPELDDRAAEAWEPLVAIADLAGGEWPQAVRDAAVALSGSVEQGDMTIGAVLLGAIRDCFGPADRMTTADLLDALNADDDLPFGGWGDGKGLADRRLASLLRPYKVKPRRIRVGDDANHRGYLREQFEDAWSRWVPTPPQAPRAPHVPQAAVHAASDVADSAPVADEATLEQELEAVRLGEKFGVEV